jgi:hypothetical protein
MDKLIENVEEDLYDKWDWERISGNEIRGISTVYGYRFVCHIHVEDDVKVEVFPENEEISDHVTASHDVKFPEEVNNLIREGRMKLLVEMGLIAQPRWYHGFILFGPPIFFFIFCSLMLFLFY